METMPMHYRRLFFTLAVIWALLILALSLMPRFNAGGAPLNHGVIAHLGAYITLAGLIFFCLEEQKYARARLAGFLVAGAWGVAVEFGQALLSYRTFDPGDIFLNLGAALLGSNIAFYLKASLVSGIESISPKNNG